jgi:hypothetical protein
MVINIQEVFAEFKNSNDTLRVYQGGDCIFRSDRDVLGPLVDFIAQSAKPGNGIIILDKVMGNAAALLAVKAGAVRVFSPLGSDIAVESLHANKVEFFLEKKVPFILARNGKDMCPMEKLSLDKSPDEFYEIIKARFNNLPG